MRTDALRDFLAHIAMTIPRLWGGERRLLTRGRPRLRFAVELLEDRCTPTIYIRSVPFIINAPGTYALAGDLNYGSLTGTAITIGASNVVVDLAGHKLWTSAGLGTTATGIAANDQANVTVRNGTLRGFQFGIRLVGEDGYGNRVENLQLNNITYNSIWVDGTGSVVEKQPHPGHRRVQHFRLRDRDRHSCGRAGLGDHSQSRHQLCLVTGDNARGGRPGPGRCAWGTGGA